MNMSCFILEVKSTWPSFEKEYPYFSNGAKFQCSIGQILKKVLALEITKVCVRNIDGPNGLVLVFLATLNCL